MYRSQLAKMYLQSFLVICLLVVVVTAREKFNLDERWVCGVKRSCIDCLQLPHCSWCEAESKCSSEQMSNFVCNENIVHVDYGLSFAENAECSCARGKMDLQCYPPGVTEGPECSGRGECVCGHCVCDDTPDVQFPTKAIMGEFCEFDNFSCDGPKCNEGPYSLTQPVLNDEDDFNADVNNTDAK